MGPNTEPCDAPLRCFVVLNNEVVYNLLKAFDLSVIFCFSYLRDVCTALLSRL